MQMTARLGGTPLYCGVCSSTLVQIKRTDCGGVATAECRNPKCEMCGKLFLAPTIQLEEVTPTMEASHG
jgi:hypothetical protein